MTDEQWIDILSVFLAEHYATIVATGVLLVDRKICSNDGWSGQIQQSLREEMPRLTEQYRQAFRDAKQAMESGLTGDEVVARLREHRRRWEWPTASGEGTDESPQP